MMSKHSAGKSTQDFSTVTSANVPRSTFNRNSSLLTTFDAGKLVPIYLDEVLPGDTFEFSMSHVSRMITPLVPTMDNIDLEIHAYFVPNRLVYDNWGQVMGENTTDEWTPATAAHGVPAYGIDVTTISAQLEGKIGDYYGIPVGMDPDNHPINVLPFRGYGLIWNEWYRNQNVQSPLGIATGDTPAIASSSYDYNEDLLPVNKPFDYFTACLPSPQKGDSSLIPINLSELIPVKTGSEHTTSSGPSSLSWRSVSSGTAPTNKYLGANAVGGTAVDTATFTPGSSVYPSNLWADATSLGDIGQSTINELRTAFQIQRLYERDARGGTRYVEMLKAHFGVNSGDYRLQRPEFLGALRYTMGIHQVAQTSATGLTGGSTELGGLAAYAHSQGSGHLFTKSFVEHGFVHVFAIARHKKTYSEGLDRFWSRRDRFDYYHPVLAHISEQPVYQSEIYALTANAGTVFGYNEAWSDYRYKPSRATSLMSPNSANTLDIWHFGENYSSAPTLSDSWMQDNSGTNIERTLADQTTTGDQFFLNCLFRNKATRPMPLRSIPGLIDHF